MVQEVNDNNVKGIIAENEITLVKFWADWCSPCKAIQPAFEKLSDKVDANVMCVSLTVDENPDLCDELEIRSIPCIAIYVKGELKEKFSGSDCVEKTEKYLNTL